jgi:Heparinase II/III-like protein
LKILQKIPAILSLGIANICRVGLYRLGIKARIHPVLRIKAACPAGPFFPSAKVTRNALSVPDDWDRGLWLFSHHRFPIENPPDWFANRLQPGKRGAEGIHWSRISDYGLATGDIKAIWELSRWDWLLREAQLCATNPGHSPSRINEWISDWLQHNPPYQGVNWKCGQEASFRVLHLATAAHVMGVVNVPSRGLVDLLRLHLRRISPTLSYAVGQENNHGTSEAAALFIGGSWLTLVGEADGADFAAKGRYWLEERALRLIASDGTFSQYSIVYHRLMLDSYALAETWRRALHLPAFSVAMTDRLSRATVWLGHMVQTQTGDAPNLGQNDGSQLLPLVPAAYRDFRPSLQLAAALFCNSRAVAERGHWDEMLSWLDVPEVNTPLEKPDSTSLDAGGFHVLRQGQAAAYLRYPRFHFRPNQADALHLDFWRDGENILRDGGTYSYNASAVDSDYFTGTASHNTVMFDDREQMDRVGRYLFADWLSTNKVEHVFHRNDTVSAAAGYRDKRGAQHFRTASLEPSQLTCQDKLEGNAKLARLRWRLKPGHWQLSGNAVRLQNFKLSIDSNDSGMEVRLVDGFESRHYFSKTSLPVLEVVVRVPAVVTSVLTF